MIPAAGSGKRSGGVYSLGYGFQSPNVIPGLEQGKKNGSSGATMAISKTVLERF